MASLALALTLSLVLLYLSTANAGVDHMQDKAGTDLVTVPHEYVFKAEEIAAKAIVLPIAELDFIKSLPLHDPEISQPDQEDQNSKPDDENEAWLEVERESVVGAVKPSDSDSGPFTVIHLGHRRHHNCRHKPWFRELPHNENEYGNFESFMKDNGEEVSLDSLILGVMQLEQGRGHDNWKKHSSMPQRGAMGKNIHGVRGFKRLADQESEGEKMESKQEEDEKSENDQSKEEQKEEEVEKTAAEPKDDITENEAKEEKKTDQSKEKEEKTETEANEEKTDQSKEKEEKTETKAKEELEKETTEKQVLAWLNRFRKFMNF